MTTYDYQNQCWLINGIIQRCGHLDSFDCGCYGKLHEGEKAAPDASIPDYNEQVI